jgi:hypothetical protein
MSVLKPDQRRYLAEVYGDGLVVRCGHEGCQDALEITGMSMATALDEYQIGGDQFAAVSMDIFGAIQKLAQDQPVLANLIGLNRIVHVGIAVCAVAYRRYCDEHPEEEVPGGWPSE